MKPSTPSSTIPSLTECYARLPMHCKLDPERHVELANGIPLNVPSPILLVFGKAQQALVVDWMLEFLGPCAVYPRAIMCKAGSCSDNVLRLQIRLAKCCEVEPGTPGQEYTLILAIKIFPGNEFVLVACAPLAVSCEFKFTTM